MLNWSQQGSGNVINEIIKDPNVVKAYVRHRTALEEENMKAEELEPTDDATQNERRRKKCVSSLLPSEAQV